MAVVSEVLGAHYYSHSKLNTLFMEAGAPGDPPEGNCVQKCLSWLKRTNDDPTTDPLTVLGGVLLQFMETGGGGSIYSGEDNQNRQERIRQVLARSGLAYHDGGIVLSGGQAPPVADLNEALRRRDIPALDIEFKRALAFLESDPPAAVTAACSLLESLCKVILHEEGFPLPAKESIKPLWSAVQDALGLNPASVADEDIRRMLSGLTSVVDGIGSLRTHAGSAHGHGSDGYELDPRHARLAVHAAHTLCLFAIETWDALRAGGSPDGRSRRGRR
jgi:abortive infection Abi-like protein